MSLKNNQVAIVIPAYNEEKVIGRVIKKLPNKLDVKKTTYKIEIIVVNDGSTDNTKSVVEKKYKVHLIDHILNSGAGAATRTGLNYAKKINSSYVVTMDADGQHHEKDVINLIKEVIVSDKDLIIGSRLIDASGMPWYRILGNKGLSIVTFLLFGIFVKDSQSGLRAYNRKAIDSISFHSNNYAFCSEIIWSAKKNNLKISEYPIQAIYSDYSLKKGQSNWGGIIIIKQLLKTRFLALIHG